MRIVSLSTVFPNPEEPGLGLFVRARIAAMARLAEVAVVAPVPAIDYSGLVLRHWRTPRKERQDALAVEHPKWFYPPGGSPLNVLCLFARLLPSLARLRKRFDFEVIDAHFAYPEGVAAALASTALGRPFVVTLRGSEPVFARSRFRAACIRFALRRASAVIAVSEELRLFAIQRGAAAERVFIVSNGIDRKSVYPRDREACQLRWGIKPGQRIVVTAAELIWAKGHHLLIEALRRLNAEGLPVDLYVAGGVARGGAPFEAELRRQAADSGIPQRIHFTGWLDRERLCELMSAADVFSLASYAEGWPNAVHEALACGAPVVVSRVGAAPEMVPDDRFGFVVPSGDVDALTVSLRTALDRKWDRRAIAAWGGARSWDDVAREALGVLRSAVTREAVGAAPNRIVET